MAVNRVENEPLVGAVPGEADFVFDRENLEPGESLEEYGARLADHGLRLLLDLLIDAQGSELAELELLTRDELWGALMAFNFLTRRLEAIRVAIRTLSAGHAQESQHAVHHCDHDR